MSDIVLEAWKKYLLQLQLHPLRTKAITAGVLAGCSDFGAQKISGVKKIQFRRLSLIMLYGLVYAGPFGHYLHKIMDKIFKGETGNTTTVKKVVLQQTTVSPFNSFIFMLYYGLIIEGRPWSLVKSKVKNDYLGIVLASWKFSPIVNWINYRYMPLHLRVLFQNIVASCWGIYLNLKVTSSTAIKKA